MGVKELRPKRLAEKLKRIRTDLGLSQNELLEKIGFSEYIFQGNISQYELGRREPPLPVLLRYAQIAQISVDVLIDDQQELPEMF
jgi:transcriptional regulator with XRE-family HTH domain